MGTDQTRVQISPTTSIDQYLRLTLVRSVLHPSKSWRGEKVIKNVERSHAVSFSYSMMMIQEASTMGTDQTKVQISPTTSIDQYSRLTLVRSVLHLSKSWRGEKVIKNVERSHAVSFSYSMMMIQEASTMGTDQTKVQISPTTSIDQYSRLTLVRSVLHLSKSWRGERSSKMLSVHMQ